MEGYERDMEHRLTEVEQRSKSNTHRIEKLEEVTAAINKLVVAVEKMAFKQDAMSNTISEVKTDVETLKAEPAKRWKFVVEKAIYFVIAAIMGFILAKFGM